MISVISSVQEPVPGWIDTFQGIIGLLVGTCLGIIRTFPVNTNYVVELMPSDYAVNCILSSAWDVHKT